MIRCLLFEYEIWNINIKNIDDAKNSISIYIKEKNKIEEFVLKNWGIDWKIEELIEKLRNWRKIEEF